MGLVLVGPIWSDIIRLWIHRIGRYNYVGHVEVIWVLDVETCGVLLQYRRA